ncbi:MAG: hypothetical protein KatS3mg050_0040 [Litorilinea sp.]|nr:MAG: hypothetical protein KatS3mg050_0040 [Litorilinea sp.]
MHHVAHGMKTYFYLRTAYKLSAEPIPACFLELDEHFDALVASPQEAANHRDILLAESVCSRMADVEMYAFLMEDARRRQSMEPGEDEKAAILTRSFLLGYLAACKALLDSCAVVLAILYQLPLSNHERSFSNSDYWHQLVIQEPSVHRRYHPLRLFFSEVQRWYNGMVHRIPPLVVLHSHYGHRPQRELLLKVADTMEADLEAIAREPYRVDWIDPLELHSRWKPRFLALCEKICQDIAQNPMPPYGLSG